MSVGKTFQIILFILISVIISVSFVDATDVLASQGSHPLSQISKIGSSASVDSGSDNKIDYANYADMAYDCTAGNTCEMNSAYVYNNMSVEGGFLAIGTDFAPSGTKLLVDGGNAAFLNGRVGIGTVTPSGRLHVKTNLWTYKYNHTDTTAGTPCQGDTDNDDHSSHDYFYSSQNIATCTDKDGAGYHHYIKQPRSEFIVTDDYKVGIGTQTPSQALEIKDGNLTIKGSLNTIDPMIYLDGHATAGTEGLKIWYNNSGGDSYFDNVLNNANGDIYFRTNVSGIPVNAITIKGNGKVILSRLGLSGTYNSSEVQQIWSIGSGYGISIPNNDFGSAFGIVYGHTDSGTDTTKKPIAGFGHQVIFTNNGVRKAAISLSNGNAWFGGTLNVSGASNLNATKVLGVANMTNNTFVSGTLKVYSPLYSYDSTILSRKGLSGTYNSYEVQQIWSIGSGYKINTTDNNFGNSYGIVYAHENAGTGPTNKPFINWGHQILFTSNGVVNAGISLSKGHANFAGNVHGNSLSIGTTASITTAGAISGSSLSVTGTSTLGYYRTSSYCSTGYSCSVSCTTGKVIGGGCDNDNSGNNMHESYPNSDTSWKCHSTADGPTTAYAICARIA